MSYVTDKVTVITGGSSGFGLAAARLLLEMGSKVVITGRNLERLEAAKDHLASENLLAIQADAVQTPDWRKVVQQTIGQFGRLDVLVNNHGAGVKIAEVESMGDEDILGTHQLCLTRFTRRSS